MSSSKQVKAFMLRKSFVTRIRWTIVIPGAVAFLTLSTGVRAQGVPAPPAAASTAARDDDSARPAEPQAKTSTSTSTTPQTGTNSARKTCGVTALDACAKDFLHDQAGIWTSPARVRSMDLVWLLPFGAATGAAIATDSNALDGLKGHSTLAHRSRQFSESGSPYVTVGASLLLYGIGAGKHNDVLRETGVLSTEAIVDTAVVVGVIKLATNRERPDTGTQQGRFWPDGTSNYPAGFSMPSMHAAGSWALARVIAGEYPSNPLLKIAVYGWATAVSATRVTGRKHFPSDVLVGGVTGYLIGGYVLRHHGSAYRGDPAYTLLPFSDPATQSYGLSVAVKMDALQPEALERTFHRLASRVWNRSNQSPAFR